MNWLVATTCTGYTSSLRLTITEPLRVFMFRASVIIGPLVVGVGMGAAVVVAGVTAVCSVTSHVPSERMVIVAPSSPALLPSADTSDAAHRLMAGGPREVGRPSATALSQPYYRYDCCLELSLSTQALTNSRDVCRYVCAYIGSSYFTRMQCW